MASCLSSARKQDAEGTLSAPGRHHGIAFNPLPRSKAREVTHGELQLVDNGSEVDTKMRLQRQPSYSVCLHSEVSRLDFCRNMGALWGQTGILAN